MNRLPSILMGILAAVILLPALILLGIGMKGCSIASGLANKAVDVAVAQVDPALMLKKYEWFKDAAAQCDKKLADIRVYDGRLKSLVDSYSGTPRGQWSREDREQYNIWISEVSGIQASYNMLAADYNAAMAKINYAFCNVGSVPAGGQPLPREFREYIR